jgi:signal transduction histidine kinase
VHVSVGLEGGSARLGVRDQGIGIEKEALERIFMRFERAISATAISGLGLGLYICRQIVEMHGGKISVESELGQGATFTVDLPLSEGGLPR